MDKTLRRFFTCYRCERRLPDSSFALIGPRFYKAKRMMFALHPHCHTCRSQRKGKWVEHPKYTTALDRYWAGRIATIRSSAEHRGIFFGVDSDDLLGKFLEQDGRCALTGLPLDLKKGSGKTKTGRNPAMPSVDRIDSSKHYTPDNIQIVMLAVNLMKGELPQDVFIEFCQQIVTHNMLA